MIYAKRGKRLNVMGALLSSGKLFSVTYWTTATAIMFAGFLGLLTGFVGEPLTVIVGNASIHKAKAIQPLLKVLAQRGLTLYFLPLYCPVLNRIEKLCYKMKYVWMDFKTRDAQILEADIDQILNGFGGPDYQMTFC